MIPDQVPMALLADVTLGKMLQSVRDADGDSQRPYLRAAHIQPGGRLDLNVEEQQMWFSPREVDSLTLRRGDVAIVEGGAGFGRATYLKTDLPGWGFQNSIVRLRPNPAAADGRYLRYFLEAALANGEIGQVASTATLPHFTAEKVSRFRVRHTPVESQIRIADFLDRETAEIEAMNAELDLLTDTLRSRRRIAIEGAMNSTKWAPIALLAEVTLGKMLQPRKESVNEVLLPYLRAAHIQPHGRLDLAVDEQRMWFSPRDVELLTLRRGDVAIVEGGAGFGRATYLKTDLPGWGFQNSIVRLRAETCDDGRYLAHALIAARERGDIASECSASTMPHFTAEKVSRFRVPFHTAEVRSRIVSRLDSEVAHIDEMIADARLLKTLLVERRSTLITEVVTGRKRVA